MCLCAYDRILETRMLHPGALFALKDVYWTMELLSLEDGEEGY